MLQKNEIGRRKSIREHLQGRNSIINTISIISCQGIRFIIQRAMNLKFRRWDDIAVTMNNSQQIIKK